MWLYSIGQTGVDGDLEGQALVVSLALNGQAEPVWLQARVSLSDIG